MNAPSLAPLLNSCICAVSWMLPVPDHACTEIGCADPLWLATVPLIVTVEVAVAVLGVILVIEMASGSEEPSAVWDAWKDWPTAADAVGAVASRGPDTARSRTDNAPKARRRERTVCML
jgi:hypothetical protein